jgi:hypothetical protein
MPWEKNRQKAQENTATPVAGSVYSTVGGVVAFKFKEQWSYNTSTGMIDKKVIAVAPKKAVLSPTSGEVRGYRSLFWVKLD